MQVIVYKQIHTYRHIMTSYSIHKKHQFTFHICCVFWSFLFLFNSFLTTQLFFLLVKIQVVSEISVIFPRICTFCEHLEHYVRHKGTNRTKSKTKISCLNQNCSEDIVLRFKFCRIKIGQNFIRISEPRTPESVNFFLANVEKV